MMKKLLAVAIAGSLSIGTALANHDTDTFWVSYKKHPYNHSLWMVPHSILKCQVLKVVGNVLLRRRVYQENGMYTISYFDWLNPRSKNKILTTTYDGNSVGNLILNVAQAPYRKGHGKVKLFCHGQSNVYHPEGKHHFHLHVPKTALHTLGKR